jgi:NAD(P)H-hydrate epimerase
MASHDILTGYLNAEDAAALDAELMSSPGFSLEQLMELAGLSVAEAIYQMVPPPGKILVVCGPGNNGGDGLVAARHLVMFGYESVVVVYPKQPSKQHFVNLVQQCRNVGIPVLEEMPSLEDGYSAIVDSIFGFSFHGTLREPFATIVGQIKEAQETLKITTLSVDIPSGWNVNGGDEAGTGFTPDALISLTAPKLAAKSFKGRHFVGGRFLTPNLAEKYNIKVRKMCNINSSCY